MKNSTDIFRLYGLKLIIMVLPLVLSMAFVVQAAEPLKKQTQGRNDTEVQTQGVFYYRIEPSFYTGFAPRCQDPNRIHIHLGRGNQVRVTLVLSNQIVDSYLPDLAVRYRVYHELIKKSKIKLTQNMGFEKFSRIISEEKILKLADEKNDMALSQYRKISLEILEKLNPGEGVSYFCGFRSSN